MKLVLYFGFLGAVSAALSCDDEYMSLCPESMPSAESLGACLKENAVDLTSDCTTWLALQEACATDLDTGACAGYAWNGMDAGPCLTDWKRPDELSEACQAALPAKEQAAEETLDPEIEKKRQKRKLARKKAAEEVRNLNNKGSSSSSSSKKKTKKRRKPVSMDDDL